MKTYAMTFDSDTPSDGPTLVRVGSDSGLVNIQIEKDIHTIDQETAIRFAHAVLRAAFAAQETVRQRADRANEVHFAAETRAARGG